MDRLLERDVAALPRLAEKPREGAKRGRVLVPARLRPRIRGEDRCRVLHEPIDDLVVVVLVEEPSGLDTTLVENVEHRVEVGLAHPLRDIRNESTVVLVVLLTACVGDLHLRITKADEPEPDVGFDTQARTGQRAT